MLVSSTGPIGNIYPNQNSNLSLRAGWVKLAGGEIFVLKSNGYTFSVFYNSMLALPV